MSKFNAFMNSHFSSCRLLAFAHDNCRDREVRIFQIPGYWDCAGVSDGTDAWIAPVLQGTMYFHRVDVWQMLRDLQDGKELADPTPVSTRRRVALDDEAPPAPRRRIVDTEPTTAPRRRNVEL